MVDMVVMVVPFVDGSLTSFRERPLGRKDSLLPAEIALGITGMTRRLGGSAPVHVLLWNTRRGVEQLGSSLGS
jgi:hypothetical protein